MSASMRFEGRLCFASTADRDAWIESVTTANDTVIDRNCFASTPHTIEIEYDLSAPSTMWDATLTALYEAAHLAWVGVLWATYEGDERTNVVATGRQRATPKATSQRIDADADELLVFYALDEDNEEPEAGTPSYVAGAAEAIDKILMSDRAPYISITNVDDLIATLDRAPEASAAIIEWIVATAKWTYGYQFEPRAIAGDGTARARGLEDEKRGSSDDDDEDAVPVTLPRKIASDPLRCLVCGSAKIETRSDDFGVEARCLECETYDSWKNKSVFDD